MKKLVKTAIMILLIFILIVDAVYVIKIEDGSYKAEDWSNAGFVVDKTVLSNVTSDNITSTDDGWSLNVDLDTKVDEIIQIIEKEEGDLDNYISKDKQKEYLKAFIRAELITKYPDLRSADKIGTETAEGEIQGCIQIHKALSNGDTQVLTYIDYETFDSYITSGNSQATNHFTLDENENLIVAGWTRTTKNITSNVPDIEEVVNKVEYSLLARDFNYRAVASPFAMPFDFLWALTVIGDDEDFSYEVAKLAAKSKIVITIQENFSTSTTTEIEEYDSHDKVIREAIFNGFIGEDDEFMEYRYKPEPLITQAVHYKTETRTKIESSSIKANVTEADTWIYKYENTVTNTTPDTPPTPEQKENIDDTEYEFKTNVVPASFKVQAEELLKSYLIKEFCDKSEDIYEQKKNNNEFDGIATHLKYERYSKKTNQVITYNSTYTSNKYELGTPVITEKTEKDSEEENFVTLFVKSTTAKNNILSGAEWLFEILANGPKTSNMVDLVKYLLYKATGVNYGVTEYTFKIIDINSMNTVKGNSTENFIKAWENGTLWLYETGQSETFPTGYLTEDETCYIVYEDGSAGHNNIAYGWATFITSSTTSPTHSEYAKHPRYGAGYWNWRQAFGDVGISVESLYTGSFVDKEAAISAFENTILPSFRTKVDNYLIQNLPEYEFSQKQKDALISVCYQYGNINGFADAYRASLNEDGTIDGEKLKAKFDRFNYTGTVNNRKYANWLLFTEGTYIDRAGNEITMATIVDAAYIVADHFLNSGVDVHYAGNSVDIATNNGRRVSNAVGIQRSWELPIEQPNEWGIVCATFVSMAIWKAGVIEEEIIDKYAFHACSGVDGMIRDPECIDEWEIITNWDELIEGDIVYMEGHVFIFMEGEMCLDQGYCVISSGGSDNRRVLTNASGYRSKFRCGYRYVGK